MGADGIELDVQLSADGVPMICHDFSLERTTDGRGEVSAHTQQELQALDAGSHFSRAFSDQTIPTLAQVLDTLGQRLGINVELKTRSRLNNTLEAAVAALIRERGLQDRVILSSFNPFSLWRARVLAAEIPRGLLYAPDLSATLSRGWAIPFLALEAVHPSKTMVDAAYVRWAHGKGYDVNVWTVNAPEEIERLIDLGVDTIITDCPDVALEIRNRKES
jgi:glycerophosphoryl diester phosphodiesterase